MLDQNKKSSIQVKNPSFSFLFFSDIRKDLSDKVKYNFMREITLFADNANFTAIYFPERHFHEFGSIYPNPALLASWLIPQTRNIRFRTAGISLPLHHPAEIVEWWAVNDVLSDGRIDLGFGSGWHKSDFILSPDTYHNRKDILAGMIEHIKSLWRGEKVSFLGPDKENILIEVFPKPIQNELNVWLLVTQNDEAFRFAGAAGYNVFTMLYGYDLTELKRKIQIYRDARKEQGFDPNTGIVTLMLHTLVLENSTMVMNAVEKPFKEYIKSALDAHLMARTAKGSTVAPVTNEEKQKILEYSFHRYYKTCALFGTVEECRAVIDNAVSVGVNEIACLMDFGVDYNIVLSSLPILKSLVSEYIPSEQLNYVYS